MTTPEYMCYNERELKRLEVRSMCEDDPRKLTEIRKNIAHKRNLLHAMRKFFGGGLQRADLKFPYD